MSDDLVARLRSHVRSRLSGSAPVLSNGAWEMMLEAADEIKRLRAEAKLKQEKYADSIVKVVEAVCDYVSPRPWCDDAEMDLTKMEAT